MAPESKLVQGSTYVTHQRKRKDKVPMHGRTGHVRQTRNNKTRSAFLLALHHLLFFGMRRSAWLFYQLFIHDLDHSLLYLGSWIFFVRVELLPGSPTPPPCLLHESGGAFWGIIDHKRNGWSNIVLPLFQITGRFDFLNAHILLCI
jgi:hypothetical protein